MADKLTPAQQAAKDAKDSGFNFPAIPTGQTGHPNIDKNITSKYVKKIDAASAIQLLTEAKKTAGYEGTLSKADVQDFINKFNANSVEQARTLASTVQTRLKPGATAEDIANATQNTLLTVYPDYFNPRNFAKDFIWTKWTNPTTSKAFGGNALAALNQVRQMAKGWGLPMSDQEVNAYAKEIAMKTKSAADVNAEITLKGSPHYPQFADQIKRVLSTNPLATMYDIAQPYIGQMAKTLEMDPDQIDLTNPLLDKALRPDGTAGKLPAQSLADFNRSLMNTPQWESTSTANQMGRDSAVGLARAMGMGV